MEGDRDIEIEKDMEIQRYLWRCRDIYGDVEIFLENKRYVEIYIDMKNEDKDMKSQIWRNKYVRIEI